MARHIARRLALLLPILLGVSLITFALLRLLPGDPAQVLAGERASAAQIGRLRVEQGLDRPLLSQYGRYLGRLARLDLGRSLVSNLPVTAELAQRLPATAELSLAALLIACLAGIPLGVLAAQRRNSALDWLASGGALLGVSMPLFWLGLLLIHLFGYRLGWLPPSGRLTIGIELRTLHQAYGNESLAQGALGAWLLAGSGFLANFHLLNSLLTANFSALLDALRHLLLPALTLSTVPLAVVMRMTRNSLLEAMADGYVRTARAKGLTERSVLLRHALRNASLPILTVIGLQLGLLFSGAILVETIFSWPGVGQLIVDRVLARDYPVIQGVILVIALLIVLISLATDVAYAYLDPRIRHE